MRTALLSVIGLVAGMAPPAAADAFAYPGGGYYAQASKGRQGQDGAQRGRDTRPERRSDRDERRERLSDDERRALHRDLDKASRELYQRRNQR
jgi:hypothetical protein